MNSNKNRVAIYIDGSNFYFKMRSPLLNFSNLVKFNYRGFAEWLALGREIISCRYYVGVVRTEENNLKSYALRSNQQKLFSHLLSEQQNFTVKRGFLMKAGSSYHEKGVDVQLAIDLLIGAYENLYDTAIIISSDTDLLPAIKKIKFLNKMVEYIGFAHQPSIGMQTCATRSRLLIKEELEPFVDKTLI